MVRVSSVCRHLVSEQCTISVVGAVIPAQFTEDVEPAVAAGAERGYVGDVDALVGGAQVTTAAPESSKRLPIARPCRRSTSEQRDAAIEGDRIHPAPPSTSWRRLFPFATASSRFASTALLALSARRAHSRTPSSAIPRSFGISTLIGRSCGS